MAIRRRFRLGQLAGGRLRSAHRCSPMQNRRDFKAYLLRKIKRAQLGSTDESIA